MPHVSVIIPTYNRAQLVVLAIESALNQSFNDFEVIVVDDGSTDETRETLQSYSGKIRYIYQENAGVGAARNKGIESAAGAWLAFLDSDDEWDAGYLSEQVSRTGAFPDICTQVTDCRYTGLKGERSTYFGMNNILQSFKGSDYVLVKEPFRFVIEHAPWQVGSAIFRSDSVKKAGLFDESLKISEDLDFMARMALQGPLGMIREPFVSIYRRNESVTCLSHLAKSHPIQARESDEKLYERLMRIETLTSRDRKSLNKILSANKRAIGNLLLKDGKRKEAREQYRHALSVHPSMRSFGKYVLTLPRTSSLAGGRVVAPE